MFDFVRQHRRLLQFVLLLLVIPSFVLVGAFDVVSRSGSSANALAEIDGHIIDRSQFDRAHRTNLEQVASQLGGKVSVLSLDSPASRLASLDRLVGQEMLKVSAVHHRIRASDSLVAGAIAQIPEFQKDGQFNLEQAQTVLKRAGYTVVGFEEGLREELSADRLPSGISTSSIASRRLARLLSLAETESREVLFRRFEVRQFLAAALPTPEEVKAAYDANPAAYQLPESVDLEVVVLRSGRSPTDLETFTNLVFEKSESLGPVSDQLKLPIVRVNAVGRNDPTSGRLASGAAGLPSEVRVALANQAFRSQLFLPEALQEGRNLPATEVGAGLIASARVVKHQAAAQRPFDQVEQSVRSELQQQRALTLAAKAAQDWVERSGSNPTGQPEGNRLVLRREDPYSAARLLGIPDSVQGRQALDTVFRLSRNAAASLNLGESGHLAVRLVGSSVAPADSAEASRRTAGGYRMLEQSDGGMSFQFWMRQQESVLKVKRYSDKLRAADS